MGGSDGMGGAKSSEILRDQDHSVWTPPVYQKGSAAESIITKALEANILMKELSIEDRTVTLALSAPRLWPPPHLAFAPAPALASPYPTLLALSLPLTPTPILVLARR